MLLVLSVFGLAACGDPVPRVGNFGDIEATRCRGAMAQIALYDVGFQPLCGCAEGSAAVAASAVTCTVPAGTTVFFHYSATRVTHQIVSNGAPSFVSSPVVDPLLPASPRAHVVRFDASGTYLFQDAYNAALTGQIVVP